MMWRAAFVMALLLGGRAFLSAAAACVGSPERAQFNSRGHSAATPSVRVVVLTSPERA